MVKTVHKVDMVYITPLVQYLKHKNIHIYLITIVLEVLSILCVNEKTAIKHVFHTEIKNSKIFKQRSIYTAKIK